jgi:oligopeptide/dipeptide ABC transporter ATP-binding protein
MFGNLTGTVDAVSETKDKSALLEIKDLKKWFPIRRGLFSRTMDYVRALDGVSLYVHKGETLGLVGESGCGKTTLGRVLLGLEKADGGEIHFDCIPVHALTGRQMNPLRKRIQVIFQDPQSALNPRMTVMDIVTEGMARFKMISGDRRDHARRLMREVGLPEDAAFRFPHEFSGGQRQRICIARAISLRPDFIICDEAVSALDVSIQAQIINLLMSLQDRYGVSYLFISHDLSVVANIADRVAVMYLGRIVETGPTTDVIHQPLHPYTQALISAVPVPGGTISGRIILKGDPPSAASPPSGCPFHPRCHEVMPVCADVYPTSRRVGGRDVDCHLY